MKDLTGQRFGRLLVLKESYDIKSTSKNRRWICICDCGNEVVVFNSSLTSGNTKSCKCLSKEGLILRNINGTTHGMTKTRQYRIWFDMIKRCSNTKCISYAEYGGRGICVCERWEKFELFWEDMKDNYQDNLTLDRINNDDGYYLENCKWSTRKEQANNRRTNRTVTYLGETLTLKEMAEKYLINPSTLKRRLNRCNDVAKAITNPLQKRKKEVSHVS